MQEETILFTVFEVFCSAFFVEVVAFAVDDHDEGHFFYIKSAECFGLEIFVGNQFCTPPIAPK